MTVLPDLPGVPMDGKTYLTPAGSFLPILVCVRVIDCVPSGVEEGECCYRGAVRWLGYCARRCDADEAVGLEVGPTGGSAWRDLAFRDAEPERHAEHDLSQRGSIKSQPPAAAGWYVRAEKGARYGYYQQEPHTCRYHYPSGNGREDRL